MDLEQIAPLHRRMETLTHRGARIILILKEGAHLAGQEILLLFCQVFL